MKNLLSNSIDTGSKYMPRMEVLDLSTTVRGNSTLELVEDLYRVAAERFSNPEVASLRSIIISVFNSAVAPGTDGSKIGQACMNVVITRCAVARPGSGGQNFHSYYCPCQY